MPGNGSDGSITIDTELDNSGFDKGSDKLLGAVKDLTNAVDNLGDNMMSSFSKVIPLLSTMASAATQVNGEMTQTATQTADANERVVESEQHVAQAAQQAAGAVQQQGNGMSTLAAGAASAQGSISSLEREVNSLSAGMQSISQSAETGFANGNAVLSFDAKLSDMESKLDAAKAKLEAFGATKIPTEEYTSLTQEIEKAEQALFKLYERRDNMQALGIKENTAQWQRLALQIKNAEQLLTGYERARDSLTANGSAFISGSDTAEYARMQASIESVSADLDRNRQLIDSEALAQARLNIQIAQEKLLRAQTTSQVQAAQSQLLQAQQNLRLLAAESSLASQNTAPKESTVSSWKKFGDIIKNATSSAVKGIKNYITNAKKASVTSNALVKSLTSLKRMLITRIKRMFISAIFNEAKAALNELAKYSSAFDKSMSNIKNSAKGVAGNLAVTLGNLISTIEPIITSLLTSLSSALTQLNALFAAIGGKSTVTVAQKQTASYAASLSDTADAAKDAKAQLMGFDKINKLNDDSDSGSSGGAITYEEKPIESIFKNLKDMIAANDWYGIGESIAEKLNAGMQKVDDWFNNTLKPKGTLWAQRIAEIFNGLTDGFAWENLGKMLADGINSITSIINTFFTTYNFENLGTSLGDALNGLVNNVDWAGLGQSFAQKWQALVELIHGFVHRTNWAELGKNIGIGVQSWFDTIDWVKLADSIVTGFNGLVTALKNAIKNVKWSEIGKTLADSLWTLISEIDWAELGGLISEAVIAILDLALELVYNIDWYALGDSIMQGIIDLLQNIDWIRIITELGAALVSVIVGAFNLLFGAVGGLSQKLADAFKGIGLDGIAGFFQGITDALKTSAKWLKEHIVDPVVNGVKNLFGIHSPSTVFAEIGGFLIEGLLNGISNAWKSIVEFFTGALSGLKTKLSDAWSSMKDTVSKKWDEIKTATSEKWNSIKTALTNTWTNLKTTASTKWGEIKSTISTSWTNIKTSVSSAASTLATTVANKWNDIKNTASTKWNDIKTTVSTKWSGLKDTLKSIDFGSIGSNLVSGLKNGIVNAWDGLKKKVGGLCSDLVDGVKGLFGIASPSKVFAEIGNFLGLGLEEGLDDSKRGVLNTAANLAESVTDEMAGAEIPTLQISGDTMLSGLDRVADKLSGIAETFKLITNMLTSMGGLKVPEIAAGRVIPAKTRVDSSTVPAGSNTGVNMTELKRVLREVLSELGMDGDVVVPVNLDGDVIYQLVVKKNRNNTIKTGVNALG